MEACWEALEKVGMTDVVQSLNGKLDYHIKENGEGLSAGQLQRIAIARALLRRPSVLILEEATSNLDEQTEAKITNNIRYLRGDATVIIVSHRPGVLKFVDCKINLSPIELDDLTFDSSNFSKVSEITT